MQRQDISSFIQAVEPTSALVGIDYGQKRIGVAVSDLGRMIASPLSIVSSLDELDRLLQGRKIGGFIVGLPIQMNGQEGPQAQLTRAWTKKLQKKYNLPIMFWDERLTSAAADRFLIGQMDISRNKQKRLRDQIAAGLILQSFLDSLSLYK